jgi:hypothetical protein
MTKNDDATAKALSIAFVFLLVLAQAGCTVTRMDPVGADPLEIARQVDIGDHIRVFTRDETMHEFEVTRLNSSFIGGENVEIPYQDIAHLDVRKVDEWQTAFVVVHATISTAVLIALLAFIVILATL